MNFKPIVVPTKFSREGVKYKDLSEDEKKEYEENSRLNGVEPK